MATVSELVTKFSFIGSLKPQLDFNKGLSASIKGMTGFMIAAKAAVAGLTVWANKAYEPVNAMADLQAQTKANIESLQELGYVASKNSSSIDSFGKSITVMTRRVGRYAQFGGGAAKNSIQKLGLQIKDGAGDVRDSVDIFMDIADKMRNMSEGEKLAIIQDFGMSADMLQTLSLTREELQAMRKEARDMGVFSQEDADAVGEYGSAVTKLKYAMTSLQTSIAIGFAPMLKEMAESFTALLERNKEWIKKGLERVGKVLLATSEAINILLPVFGVMIGMFVAAKIATLGLAGAMGLLFSPVVLTVAAITAALLIIDDLIVAMQGGESVIADFFMAWLNWDIVPTIKAIADNVKTSFKMMWNVVEGFTGLVTGLFKGFWSLVTGDWDGALESFNSAASAVFNTINENMALMWNGIKSTFKDVFDIDLQPIEDAFKAVVNIVTDFFSDGFSGAIDKIGIMIKTLGTTIKGFLEGLIPQWMKDSLEYLGVADFGGSGNNEQLYTGGAVNQSVMQLTQPQMHNTTNNQDVNITVNTRDPEVAANKVVAGIGGASSMILAKRGGQ